MSYSNESKQPAVNPIESGYDLKKLIRDLAVPKNLYKAATLLLQWDAIDPGATGMLIPTTRTILIAYRTMYEGQVELEQQEVYQVIYKTVQAITIDQWASEVLMRHVVWKRRQKALRGNTANVS